MARSSSAHLKNSDFCLVSSYHVECAPFAVHQPTTHSADPSITDEINMMNDARAQLDRLFAVDAGASVVFGILALLAPHGVLTSLSGGLYSHGVHETLR
jgi:hypothetical protein